jgi:hypothetical protein
MSVRVTMPWIRPASTTAMADLRRRHNASTACATEALGDKVQKQVARLERTNMDKGWCFIAIGSLIYLAQAILGQAIGAFVFQAYFHQCIWIIDPCVRVCNDSMPPHQGIHVIFPSLVIASPVHFHFLPFTKSHRTLLAP